MAHTENTGCAPRPTPLARQVVHLVIYHLALPVCQSIYAICNGTVECLCSLIGLKKNFVTMLTYIMRAIAFFRI